MIYSWNLKLAIIKSTRLMIFKILQSIPESQKDNYQSFIIWFCGKATLKKKISKSLYQ